MSIGVVEEVECIHFAFPQPVGTCSICKNGLEIRADKQLEPERVILPIPDGRHPQKAMYMWYPFRDSLESIPKDRDFVHIVSSFTSGHFDLLCEHLSGLVLVEIVPSFAHLVEDHLAWFSQFRVGISARRRYRQS